jgi:hypothetical protein
MNIGVLWIIRPTKDLSDYIATDTQRWGCGHTTLMEKWTQVKTLL